jgi:hypothetical protein
MREEVRIVRFSYGFVPAGDAPAENVMSLGPSVIETT